MAAHSGRGHAQVLASLSDAVPRRVQDKGNVFLSARITLPHINLLFLEALDGVLWSGTPANQDSFKNPGP